METDETVVHELALAFTQIECAGCGRLRGAAKDCDQCGMEGGEDPLVAERELTVADALAELTRTPSATAQMEPCEQGVFTQIGEWIAEFMDAAAQAGSGTGGKHELAELARELVQLETDAGQSEQLRPHMWYWTALLGVLGELRNLASHTFAALTARDAEAASRLGEQMQTALDAGKKSASAMIDLIELSERIECAPYDTADPVGNLVVLARETARNREGQPITESDRTADELFELVTGLTPCPPELATGLRATALQVESVADTKRFWECAGLAYRRLTSAKAKGKGAFAKVAAGDTWIADIREVHSEIFEGGLELRHLFTIDRTRTRARQLVRFGHLIAERCAPPLLGTLLASYRGRDYRDLADRPVGDLLNQAHQVGLGSLTYGIDRALRHADAHGKLFTITETGVQFRSEPREYDFLTFDQLLDRVVGGWESALAMDTAVTCALATERVEVDVDPLAFLDLNQTERIRLVFELAGWNVTHVEATSETIAVVGEAPIGTPTLSTTGVLLTPYVEGNEQMRIDIVSAGKKTLWAGPASALKAFAASPDDLRELGVLRICAAWTKDGQPLASAAQLRKAISSIVAHKIVEEIPYAERQRVARIAARHAKAVGEESLAKLLRQMSTELQRMGGGQSNPKRWRRLTNSLFTQVGQEVPPLQSP